MFGSGPSFVTWCHIMRLPVRSTAAWRLRNRGAIQLPPPPPLPFQQRSFQRGISLLLSHCITLPERGFLQHPLTAHRRARGCVTSHPRVTRGARFIRSCYLDRQRVSHMRTFGEKRFFTFDVKRTMDTWSYAFVSHLSSHRLCSAVSMFPQLFLFPARLIQVAPLSVPKIWKSVVRSDFYAPLCRLESMAPASVTASFQ